MSGLVIRGLRLELAGAAILKGVDLTVTPGEMVGLIGPNGAGKSSLLRATLGLVSASAGGVDVDGHAAEDLEPKERARLLAYAPQGAPVHWPLSVERLVGLGRIPHLQPWQTVGTGDDQAVDRALAATDTQHLRARLATTLSGGEKARVMLARAMAVESPYLLADEPTASLDPYHQIQVMEILRRLARSGHGVLIVLHDLTLALRFCDRLALLDDGALVMDGPPQEVLTPENLARVYHIQVATGAFEAEPYLVPWATVDPHGGT